MLGTNRDHYEVVRISSHNGYKLGNSYLEPAEIYPGTSLWGLRGWTCTSLDRAEQMYDELQKKVSRKKEEATV